MSFLHIGRDPLASYQNPSSQQVQASPSQNKASGQQYAMLPGLIQNRAIPVSTRHDTDTAMKSVPDPSLCNWTLRFMNPRTRIIWVKFKKSKKMRKREESPYQFGRSIEVKEFVHPCDPVLGQTCYFMRRFHGIRREAQESLHCNYGRPLRKKTMELEVCLSLFF